MRYSRRLAKAVGWPPAIQWVLLWVALAATTSGMAEQAGLLTVPGKLVAGGASSLTFTLLDAGTRQPLSGQVEVEFLPTESAAILLFAGDVGPTGRLTVPFQVPSVSSGIHKVRVRSAGGVDLEATVSVSSAPALLIETDKPIYKPGQTIQGRIVRLNNSLAPFPGPVEVVVTDGKGLRIARFNLLADDFGVAPFELELASELNQGVWKIQATSDGSESLRDLRVEPYVLPRFEVILTPDRNWALVDEPVTGSVQSSYFFGRPVQGTAHLEAFRWVGQWEKYAELEGMLAEGEWDFQIPAVNFVAGVPQNGGQGTIRLDLTVTDTTGESQSVSLPLTVAQAAAVVRIASLIPNLKPGLPVPFRITTESPGGDPLEEAVDVLVRYFHNGGGESVDQRQLVTVAGRADLELTPPLQIYSAKVEASLRDHDGLAEIYLAASFSPSNNFLTLHRSDGEGVAQPGQVVSYEVSSSLQSTVFYEVYAAGRTLFSTFSESGNISFVVTPEMLPAARVVAYQITPESEVIADTANLEARGSAQIEVEAGFNQDEVRPGDPVTVTIRTGLHRRSLLGVSIVDQSVLSLGRSRLYLEQVFEELERRFLAPLAIAVQNEPFGPGLGLLLFEPFDQPSTRETFGMAGLQVVATPNLSVPTKLGREFFDGLPILSPPPGGGGQSNLAAPEETRLRQFFPETWLWNPTLLTDENGVVEIELTAPDSITGWSLSAVATHSTTGGDMIPGIAFGEGELTVFQEFFVEPSLPVEVTRGERFPLQIDLFNYLDQAQQVDLTLAASPAFELLEGAQRQVEVAPNSTASVEIPVRPRQVGSFPLQITASSAGGVADAVLRPLAVAPEGFPSAQVINSVLEAGREATFQLDIPEEAVPDSVSAFLNITPSAVAQTMQGVGDLLEMPYGCGEQNMIFLAPDIEILKYLREIGELNPETRAEAENFVNLGYQRQLTFQTSDGGFSAFGDPPAGLWLTAFVLSTFSGAREIRDIDEAVLQQAAELLLSRQNEDGSFQTDDFLIHTELLGGVENLYTMSAYVANALAEYGAESTRAGLEKAAGYLVARQTDVDSSPYPLAIAAVALFRSGFETAAEAFLDRLLELAIQEGPGIHWEPFPVETTGYAAQAMLLSNQGAGRPELQAALDWLVTQRNSLGGYGGSTQDTVVALRALFSAARSVNRNLNIPVRVTGGEETLLELLINAANFDLLHQLTLPLDGRSFRIENQGDASVGYQVTTRFNLPQGFTPPDRDLTIDVEYDATHIEVDDLVDVTVSLLYTGPKERTGMVIADIGIPTGFAVVQESLDALIEDQIVSRAELAGRKVIFYVDSLPGSSFPDSSPITPEPLRFGFQIRALYPVRTLDVVSQAYEYYDSGIRGFHLTPALQIVKPGVPAPRIDSVSEREGSGGTILEVRGSGFLAGSLEILFNGRAAEILEIISDSLVRIRVPNLVPGQADLEIITNGGHASAGESFQVLDYRLYLPLYSDTRSFSGLAFSNASEREARLVLSARSSGGTVVPIQQNPRQITLQPGGQLARLASEIWPDPEDGLDAARWIELRSDNSEVSGIFQFGGPGQLDGMLPAPETLSSFWFTRVHHGATAFLDRPARMELLIINPYQSAGEARITLYPAVGSPLSVSRPIPAYGSLAGDIQDFFGEIEVGAGSLRVDLEGTPGGVGFARIELGEGASVVGLSGRAMSQDNRSWSARVASIDDFFTHLKLVNLSDQERNLLLRFRPVEDGAAILTRALVLPPGGQFDEFANQLWAGVQPSAGSSLLGSLEVEADGPGITGDILFGGRSAAIQAALLPLQEGAVRSVLFSHVADNRMFFTGLALHNPNQEPAQVRIMLYQSSGNLVGETQFEMAPGSSRAAEVPEFVAAGSGIAGGYLTVKSSVGIIVQEMFGDRLLRFLSAVPASRATLANDQQE